MNFYYKLKNKQKMSATFNGMKYFALLFIFLLSFNIVSAQVVITEIMYDLDGSDSGREWIEIFNSGSESIDISSWKLYENETNHKLKFFQGNETLSTGGYAIIADNPEKFLIDNSDFSGTIFDSSFSFKNTGETIILRDADLTDVDTVAYNPEQGAKGDGNSLQKTNDGWIATIPTPSLADLEALPPNLIPTPSLADLEALPPNLSSSNDDGDDVETNQQEQSPSPVTTTTGGGGSWPVEPQMFARVKSAPHIAVVGADVLFKGEALGLEKKPMTSARYLWTFGDGGSKEGESVLYHYNYPGKYVVILNASSGEYSASDRVEIEAIPADISIYSVGTDVDSFVGVQNNTKYELDLSWWRLHAGDKFFTIPKDTIILTNSKTIFPPQHTEFDIKIGDKVELLYPNSIPASSYTWTSNIQVAQAQNIQVTKSKPAVSKTKDRSLSNVEVGPLPVSEVQKETGTVKEPNVKTIAENQSANIFTGASGNKGGIYKWLFAVAGLLTISIAGVFLTKKDGKINPLKSISTEADEYKIIEE